MYEYTYIIYMYIHTYIFHIYIYISQHPYLFICWCTSRLLPSPRYCKEYWNTGVHVSLSILIPPGYMPRSGVAGSYDSSIPSFSRNLQTVLHTGCSSLCYHQECNRVTYSPHPLQNFLLVEFLLMAIMNSVRWQLIAILIFIYLIMNDANHMSCVY